MSHIYELMRASLCLEWIRTSQHRCDCPQAPQQVGNSKEVACPNLQEDDASHETAKPLVHINLTYTLQTAKNIFF